MADIELVIKIPEEVKNKIDNANEDNYKTYLWWFETTLYCAIKDGIMLPKGHGRLGDLGKIYIKLNDAQIEGTEEYKGLGQAKRIISNAPTIIEADKESEVWG